MTTISSSFGAELPELLALASLSGAAVLPAAGALSAWTWAGTVDKYTEKIIASAGRATLRTE
jgi:hypothetical protein